MLYQVSKFDDMLENKFSDNPLDAFNTWCYRQSLAEVTAEWLANKEPWRSMMTLTFREPIGEDQAKKAFRRFVKVANEIKYGNNYTRKVHHSYFSYVCGIERQERGVIHFHLIVDREIDFSWVHWYWNLHHGFAWIEGIKDLKQSLNYCLKYAVKDGDLYLYLK